MIGRIYLWSHLDLEFSLKEGFKLWGSVSNIYRINSDFYLVSFLSALFEYLFYLSCQIHWYIFTTFMLSFLTTFLNCDFSRVYPVYVCKSVIFLVILCCVTIIPALEVLLHPKGTWWFCSQSLFPPAVEATTGFLTLISHQWVCIMCVASLISVGFWSPSIFWHMSEIHSFY